MKVSREKAQENRDRVIEAAATLVRERGIEGLGIADLMKTVGLTHGGFYRQFKSKDDLILRAIQKAFESSHELVLKEMKEHTNDPFEGLVRYYVSNAHRNATGNGCIVAALASDVARQNSPELIKYVESTIAIYIENIIAALPDVDEKIRRRIALAVLAEMVGAVMLARVSGQSLADELVKTITEDLLERRSRARVECKKNSLRSFRNKREERASVTSKRKS